MDLKEIGLTIKKARENYGLTLRELAELSNEDASNLSKIEKGKINISLERFLNIISVLNFEITPKYLKETTIKNLDYIQKNLGILALSKIASTIKVDRTKLKKDLVILCALGKIEEEKLKTIRPRSVKYKKEIDLFKKMKIGQIEILENISNSEITYLRSILNKNIADKEFLTRKESEKSYLVVRIK